MTVQRLYSCNFCDKHYDIKPVIGPTKLVGVKWDGMQWQEVQPSAAESHICISCLTSFQVLERRCGGGFKCDSGPRCTSDHK